MTRRIALLDINPMRISLCYDIGVMDVIDQERFWAKVVKGDHWMWAGRYKDPESAMFRPRLRSGGRSIAVRRAMWALTVGQIDATVFVKRSCNKRGCIRPEHLYLLGRVDHKTAKPRKRLTIEDRFWPKVDKGDGLGCWLWTAAKNTLGYGVIGRGGRRGGNHVAHKLSWQIHNGPVPEGYLVLHRCDVPMCVCPSHLYLGTARDNSIDMIAKERAPIAKLNADKVHEIRMRIKSGERYAEIAADYGVAPTSIGNIATGHSWSWLK